MVNRPSTGTTWDAGGYGDVDNRFLEGRSKLVAVGIRDARGAATDLSPHNPDGSVRWSPFAQDNQIRGDLWAKKRINGVWQNNPDDNEGFEFVGAFKDGSGPSSKPKIDNDDFNIIQSMYPFDSTIVSQTLPFTFTPVETAKPLVRRLENNLPLNAEDGTNLVELPGALGAGWGSPVDSENIDRQVLLIRARSVAGKKLYTVDGYNLVRLSDVGEAKLGDKKDSAARDLTFQPLPDGLFMAMIDGAYRPIMKWTWSGGDGWTSLGGAPILDSSAPVATATTAGKATLAFPDPTGGDAPFVITAEFSVDAGVTWSAATLDGPGAVTSSAGTTTVKIKSLAAGSTLLRAVVTGDNGAVSRTAASNAITVS